ncbi:MAG: signal peptide peptidase SppA [Candidatus Acidiferrales bacterium]
MTWGKRRALVIGFLILFFIIVIWAASKPARLPSNAVLVIDADGEINEQRAPDVFADFTGSGQPVLHDYFDAIDAARGDSHIQGLVVRVGPLETGWAKLEEIRAHLIEFRKSGKPSICYLGYDGIGNPEYYLASACQQVWLVPQSTVTIRGMMAQALFLRGTLDKLKIVPEFYHIAEYKTAGNVYTEKKFTPAHREEVEGLLHSVYDQYLTDASAARGIELAKFEAIVNRAPLTTKEALDAKLVDKLAYWDQVQDYFKAHAGDWNPLPLVSYRTYLKASGGEFGGEEIAVIHATGLILSGESQVSPTQGFVMGGDSVAGDLRRARKDSSIKAIVLRVDSGGGSVVASEVIRREVELAHDVKPVVVSMSDVAASGGYWISAPANKIVADPNTITGSIGVVIGKFNISGLFNLLGLSTDSVATSDNASLFSSQQNFTPAQRAWIERSIHETYESFIKGVAQGRGMTVEAVDKIGKGRVWSGAQAKQLGLVDELGGVDTAIRVAKQLAHISASERVHIVRFPEEKSFWQQFFEREREMTSGEAGASGSGGDAAAAYSAANADAKSVDAIVRRIVGRMDMVQARIAYELHIN